MGKWKESTIQDYVCIKVGTFDRLYHSGVIAFFDIFKTQTIQTLDKNKHIYWFCNVFIVLLNLKNKYFYYFSTAVSFWKNDANTNE